MRILVHGRTLLLSYPRRPMPACQRGNEFLGLGLGVLPPPFPALGPGLEVLPTLNLSLNSPHQQPDLARFTCTAGAPHGIIWSCLHWPPRIDKQTVLTAVSPRSALEGRWLLDGEVFPPSPRYSWTLAPHLCPCVWTHAVSSLSHLLSGAQSPSDMS